MWDRTINGIDWFRQVLADAQAAVNNAKDDTERAEANIAVEVINNLLESSNHLIA